MGHLSQIYTSFTMMRFLPVLAFAAMAFAECPPPKQCMDSEFLCSGPYDEKTGCYAMDTCMQMKDSNGCPANCATFCSEKDQLCPGGVDYNGCPMKDFCAPSDSFCPAMCGKGEMVCSGGFDEMGKQMSSDYCIPMKNGDCYNNCHVSCCEESQLCPGGDYNGCPQPDFCYPKDVECPKY